MPCSTAAESICEVSTRCFQDHTVKCRAAVHVHVCCQTSDAPVVKPVVSVYPAASVAALDGKSSLLCVASDMWPPPVRFSWTRQRDGGPLEELSSAHGEQLELRGTGRAAAIVVVDRHASYTYKYSCRVRHQGVTVEAPAEQGEEVW